MGARRKPKKRKFATIEENWGEEQSDEENVVGDQSKEQPIPDCDLGCSMVEHRSLTMPSKPTLITDYFATRPKVMEQIVWDEDGEGAWFEDETLQWIGLRGVRSSKVVTNQLEAGLKRSRTGEKLVTEDHDTSPAPVLEGTTPPLLEGGMRTNSPRDGCDEVKTGETGLMDEV